MVFRLLSILPRALGAGLLALPPGPSAAALEQIQFNRDVRPILSENCYACHGHDKNQRKAKLRLDVREVAIEKEAIVPGKPEASKLVEHIFATDPDELMPPPKSRKALTPAQKGVLKEWIAQGAQYEPHWAYIKPQRPTPPPTTDFKWVRNPIDAFVLQALEAKNIRPSKEADKRTLLRRLSLDLIGLPPTPEEIAAFQADGRLNAYERQVDRLLSSPHFGERMAVPWLDLVRFADTVGYHGDQNQRIFPYRDYVIDSFNQNKPFDQFTIEQLAGDLLPNPSLKTRVATGFNRLNMMTREGGAQPKEYMAKYAADRVRTVSMAWLGSTMGCAECHDHKYDPFTSKDFYSMEAFFADLTQWGVYMDYGYTPNPDLRGFSNDHPFPPEVEVDSPYLEERIRRLRRQISTRLVAVAASLKTNRTEQAAFERWRHQGLSFLSACPSGWAVPQPNVFLKFKDTNVVATTNFTIETDGSISFSDKAKENTQVTLSLPDAWLSAVRLEITLREDVPEKMTNRKKRSPTSLALTASLKPQEGKETNLPFYFAEADHKEERFANGEPILGVAGLWKISPEHEKQTAVWLLDKPFHAKPGDQLVLNLGNAAMKSARISISPFPAADPLQAGGGPQLRQALKHSAGRGNARDSELATRTYLLTTHWDARALTEDRRLENEIRQCHNGRAFTMVAAARAPQVTRVLARGNWQDETGEIVEPETPHFLPQLPNPEGRRLNRLDLAQWLVWPDNPLTARTVVNRFWRQFFGTGLSAVVDDLGAQGEWPVAPELLDWLASEFVQPQTLDFRPKTQDSPQRWDVKHIIKLIVMSATYRQESNQRPELRELDPNNRLLSCQSPRRLEAEFIRDNALSIAGLLNLDLGGPSAHPYQPAGYYANLQFPDRDYHADRDERQYRRGVYAHWQRTFLQPMLANFDAPGREECIAARPISNTPQQALTLLNDPTFVEAARVFAQKLLITDSQTDEERLDRAFQRALARAARQPERSSLLEFLQTQRDHFREHTEEPEKVLHVGLASAIPPAKVNPAELAAWSQVCRVILNLHETITKY